MGILLALLFAAVIIMVLSWFIESAVRRGVDRALKDNRDWLSGRGGPS